MGINLSKSQSVNRVEQINNIITDVIVSNSSMCSSSSVITQDINLGNISGNLSNVNLNINSNINLDCLQSSLNDSKIQSDISQKLSQFAASEAKAGLGFLSVGVSQSDSENIAKIVNKISNSVKIDNIKKCVTTAVLEQRLKTGDIGGNVENISLIVSSITVTKCIQNDQNISSSINELASLIDQKSESSAISGLDTGTIAAIIITILIVLCSCSSSLAVLQQKQ